MARETKKNVVGILAQAAAMLAAVLVVASLLGRGAQAPRHPPATRMAAPGSPIPEEAGVFQVAPTELAVAPATSPARPARPRSLSGVRGLRAYPGAPPHIPHELAADELRLTLCDGCHRLGGYAPRFGAYTPVTPHPEYANCLQCHVPEQTTMDFVGSDWRAAAWPPLHRSAMEGSPPWIPHDLQMRGRCLTCHGGPSAAVEIRTTHPERTNCRQCHVPAGSGDADDVFTRPLDGGRQRGGGAQ